jgi:hypothetical protein
MDTQKKRNFSPENAAHHSPTNEELIQARRHSSKITAIDFNNLPPDFVKNEGVEQDQNLNTSQSSK